MIENHMVLNTPDAPWNQPDADDDELLVEDEIDARSTLEALAEDIDQLAATAADAAVCRETETLLQLAWWFTEDAMRDGLGSCGHNPRWNAVHGAPSSCPTCMLYEKLAPLARRIKAAL